MKLFLASINDIRTHRDALLGLMGDKYGVAILSNAVDYIPWEDRLAYKRDVYDILAEFRAIDTDPFDMDLRLMFKSGPTDWDEMFSRCGLVFAVGGNSFLLRRAMRQSGLDKGLARMVREERIAYGGWSAGAVIAGPTLRGIELMDDPGVAPPSYDEAICWEGLGLIDFSIVPHFRSDHPEAEAAERAAAYFERERLPFKTLRDGEVLLIDGSATSLLT